MSLNFLKTPFNNLLKFVSHPFKSVSKRLFPFNKKVFGVIDLETAARKLTVLGALVFSVAFNSDSQQVSIGLPNDGIEGTSDISYTIFLEGGATNTTGAPITGGLQFLGTATNGVDYIAPTSFSIPVGAATTILTLTVIDDAILELTEGVTTLIGALNVGTVFTGVSTANIIDNEVAVLSIGSPVDALEGTSDISFSVFLEGGMTNTIGLPITGIVSLSGTAINGIDYTDVTTFSIAPGDSSTTVTIVVIDDANVEATETVIGTISSPNVGSIGTDTATANILDDDSATGIEQIHSSDVEILVYPNPVSSTLTLSSEQQIENYSITDLNGRVMASGKLNVNEVALNVDALPEGFYFVTIGFSDESSVSKKVLKR